MNSSCKRWLGPVLGLCLVVASASAWAQQRNAEAQQVMRVLVSEGKGQIVRISAEFADVFLANPGIADIEVAGRESLYIFGVQAGRTNLFALDESEQVVAELDVIVTPQVEAVRRTQDALLGDSPLRLQQVEDEVIIRGEAESLEQSVRAQQAAEAVAENPDVVSNFSTLNQPTQVNLRVRFAEMSKEAVETLGFNFESILSSGDFLFGFATPTDLDFGPPIQRLGTGSNFIAAFDGGNLDVNAIIDALAEEGFVSIHAEPNLSAITGETAEFLAGGEFPIPVPQGDGVVAIEFRNFGVSLTFTPTILPNNRINLFVAPEVSQLSTNNSVSIGGFTIPSLITRRASTVVELSDGQSFAIAGLFQRNISQEQDILPLLGDIPVLGNLFRSTSYQRDETELVIVVTPYLVSENASVSTQVSLSSVATPNYFFSIK